MFFVILGIIGFIVVILAVFMAHKFFYKSRDGLGLLWIAIGIIFLFLPFIVQMLHEVISDKKD